MFAYIKHSGKQYKVKEGSTIVVDKLTCDVDTEIRIEDITLAVGDNDEVITKPTGVVIATVQEHFRGEKILVIKFRKKKNYKRKKGHRQDYTRLKIEKLEIN